jgi:hypothetical protein
VTCTGGCEILCSGTQACENGQVSCLGDDCTITCTGTDSCDNGVRCNADNCAITGTGNGACEDLGVCCGGGDCDGDCTSSGGATVTALDDRRQMGHTQPSPAFLKRKLTNG